ncbi:MAG: YadA-like family protein, partial [Alphaproteobacteria bacterium]|nr:YadA-like family protein [Alphaproteobacteria bacterium]
DMDFTSAQYVTPGSDLSTAVRTLDSNLYRVENDLKDLKRDFENGMASMAAMSALVPNPRAYGNTSLSVGTGAYSGHTAMAVGGFHYLTDNIMLNAGVAWGNSHDASYRLGLTWSW